MESPQPDIRLILEVFGTELALPQAPSPSLSVSRLLAKLAQCGGGALTGAMVADHLGAAVAQAGSERLYFTDISLLFEPSLALDPLALLQRLSEHRRLVVYWPGTWDGHTLTYAVPEHSHFRTWHEPRARIVQLGGKP